MIFYLLSATILLPAFPRDSISDEFHPDLASHNSFYLCDFPDLPDGAELANGSFGFGPRPIAIASSVLRFK